MSQKDYPRAFGRYEVLGILGRGSMGVVYKARDPLIGRLVAIKSIPESLGLETGKKEDYIKRLFQEARAAGALQHPNIVTIYDVGESEQGPFIAMEYLDGITLKEILSRGKKLNLSQVVELTRQVGEGLDYAHSRGIVHRDIKPANLMIVEGRVVKIMDLGIARLPFSDLTREGKLVGSPSYMSPEQLLGEELDGRSDLFSLGVVLYQATTGKKPFTGKNIQEICYRILHDDFIPPSQLEPSLSEEFDYIIAKALAKNREQRFQSGKEMFSALRELLAPEEKEVSAPRISRGKEAEPTTQIASRKEASSSVNSVYDESASFSSSSEIEDIFRDLTLSHRVLKLREEKTVKGWQIFLLVLFGLLALGGVIWFFLRG